MGLSAAVFDRLAEKIDAIYHCGSWVNLVYPYLVLETANVTGVQETLRLASQNRLKPVHYISTVDVFRSGEALGIRTIGEQGESASTGPARSLFSGYAKSKYVAESLIAEAQSRGIPTMIYRPSNIMGDLQRGLSPTSDFVIQMLLGCIKLGIAPILDAALNLVPVDYVSRAILQLSQTESPQGQGFNLVNPQSCTWLELVTWVAEKRGYKLELLPYETWCAEVMNAISQNKEHELFFLSSLFANQPFIQKSLGAFHFECEGLTSKLKPASIACAPVDDGLLNLYFDALVKKGLLPISPSPESKSNRLDLSLLNSKD